MRLPRRSRRQAVSSYDMPRPRRGRLRAGALRVVLAGGAVALLGAAAASARGLDVRERSFLPRGLDRRRRARLSLSIAEANYLDVRQAVRQLIRIDAPVGLVFFSDIPYELLPPGTPASELEAAAAACSSRPSRRRRRPSTRGGTRSGRARGSRRRSTLARDMLVRDKVKDGFIVLVSDLETAPDDVRP